MLPSNLMMNGKSIFISLYMYIYGFVPAFGHQIISCLAVITQCFLYKDLPIYSVSNISDYSSTVRQSGTTLNLPLYGGDGIDVNTHQVSRQNHRNHIFPYSTKGIRQKQIIIKIIRIKENSIKFVASKSNF